MNILPLHREIVRYLKAHRLEEKFKKQTSLFVSDIRHPSLNVEIIEPKHLRLFNFRIDRKYRAIFIFRATDVIEIIDVNNHYR